MDISHDFDNIANVVRAMFQFHCLVLDAALVEDTPIPLGLLGFYE